MAPLLRLRPCAPVEISTYEMLINAFLIDIWRGSTNYTKGMQRQYTVDDGVFPLLRRCETGDSLKDRRPFARDRTRVTRYREETKALKKSGSERETV